MTTSPTMLSKAVDSRFIPSGSLNSHRIDMAVLWHCFFAAVFGVVTMIPSAFWAVADEPEAEGITKLKRLIHAVTNRNERPKVIHTGDGAIALFSRQYDWGEHKRVQTAIWTLSQNESDELWGLLTEHFGDERYSFCYGEQGLWANFWSVGDVCLEMARDRLLCAYLQHLEPGKTKSMGGDSDNAIPPGEIKFLPQELQLKLHNPPQLGGEEIQEPTGRRVFIRWCQAKKGRLLYELQIEMCRWAIETVEKHPDGAEKPKKQFVQAVAKQMEILRETKKHAMDRTCFASPVWRGRPYPFNADEAKDGWKEYETLKIQRKEKQTPASLRK